MSDENLSIEDDDDVDVDDDGASFSASDDSSDDDGSDENVMSDSAIIAKEAERARIQAQIDEFLSRGGRITTVDSNVMNDPPRRPASNYGGQPI